MKENYHGLSSDLCLSHPCNSLALFPSPISFIVLSHSSAHTTFSKKKKKKKKCFKKIESILTAEEWFESLSIFCGTDQSRTQVSLVEIRLIYTNMFAVPLFFHTYYPCIWCQLISQYLPAYSSLLEILLGTSSVNPS